MRKMPILNTSVHQYSYNLSQHSQTRKKENYNDCKERKQPSFTGNNVVIWNPKQSVEKLLELTTDYIKVAKFKIKIHNLIVFQYSNHILLEKLIQT